MQARSPSTDRKIFLIATEESGDRLGAALMKVLRQRLGDIGTYAGQCNRTIANRDRFRRDQGKPSGGLRDHGIP